MLPLPLLLAERKRETGISTNNERIRSFDLRLTREERIAALWRA